MKYLFAYGTLRNGEHNYEKFKHGIKYVQSHILDKFKLYDLGAYPAAVFTGNSSDTITTDILAITEEVYNEIKNMELGAGYEEIILNNLVFSPGNPMIIFTMLIENLPKSSELITSGNWFKRQSKEDKMIKRKIFVVDSQLEYTSWMQGYIVSNIEDADLVLFTGGEDVDPSFYNEKEHYHTRSNVGRDLREKEIYEKALKLDKKMLGICRGNQFLTVMNGGKLIQHMQHSGNHTIVIHEELKDVIKKDSIIPATSTHHQMVYPFNLPKEDYRILASNPDRSPMCLGGNNEEMNPPCDVEIVYYPKTKCLGIQMHPEYLNNNHNTITYLRHLLDNIYDDNKVYTNSELEVQTN